MGNLNIVVWVTGYFITQNGQSIFLPVSLEELNLENVWLTHWIKSFSTEEFLGILNRTSVTWDFLAQNGQSQVFGRFWGRWLPDPRVETLGRLEFGSHSSSLAGIEASHSKWSTCWALQSYAFSCMFKLKKDSLKADSSQNPPTTIGSKIKIS